MNKESKRRIAMLFILVPILLSIYLTFKSEFLIPKGYDLAIEGYVISRTLMIIFTFYLLTQAGYYIIKNTKD
ncbi:hypothetical protein DFP93_101366 [Aneurinibacillus soli]|uniref:Uncharacterized protein n=1 Tax=Aneurinibacillus soli TaxID=1500254 RepID=A0A0U5B1X0_9BACL|nr:hypothetical protein [Aneurinibacillus soli]PYE64339.1 hypothetical protein DFP93_101366 [Aneurinibacillus soli]BAU28288.1 hypothetical protein CB4_02462 [Aneurinibacillus soli]